MQTGKHCPFPQTRGAGQPPQSTAPPHPSDVGPQATPSCAQVLGVQSDTSTAPHFPGGAPTPQPWVHGSQEPQAIVPPQPSDQVPQVKPRAAQVSGVQAPVWQMPGSAPPSPQVCPAGQVPQFR